MANLDDFFKKKDGKKSKGKKFAVSNPSLSSNDNVKNGKVKQEKPTSFVNGALLENENDLFSAQVSHFMSVIHYLINSDFIVLIKIFVSSTSRVVISGRN